MEQIKLDIVPVGVAPIAHASQFDNSRQIRFNLFNQGSPYTLTGAETVTMVVNGEDENITNTSDNYVIWDVAEEDCVEAGVIGCEIRIVLGSMLIGSKNFFLEVEMDPYDGKNVRAVTVGPADICTFETTLPEPLQSVIVDIEATGGNGTPDNPIPINGYTEANITRCGVNLWDEEYQLGEIYPSGAINPDTTHLASLNYIKVKPSTSYRLVGIRAQVGEYDRQKNFIGIVGNSYIGTNGGSVEFTTSANTEFLLFNAAATYGTTYNNDISINYPSTDTTYHPYNGNTYTIAFGQTVYGGVLDVMRGKLHVTHYGIDLGDLPWIKGGNNFISDALEKPIKRTSAASETADMICSGLIVASQSNYAQTNNSIAYYYTGSDENTSKLICNSTDYATAEAFTTAVTGMQLVYRLNTPFDIDLTPEVISAVVGENNVFADCGQTELKYLKAE